LNLQAPALALWAWSRSSRSKPCNRTDIPDGLYSKPILNAAWADADLVINMSGYQRERAFPGSEWDKVEDWPVEDPYGCDPDVYQRIFEDIRTRIGSLTARLRDGAADK
jgi:protein-tyrosine-phosphatase